MEAKIYNFLDAILVKKGRRIVACSVCGKPIDKTMDTPSSSWFCDRQNNTHRVFPPQSKVVSMPPPKDRA